MYYFGMMILGVILFLIVDMMRWNKGTPDISPMDTIKQYFNMNWLATIGGFVFAIVLLILAQNGEFQLLEVMQVSPVLSLTTAFLVGVGSTSLLKQWGGKIPEFKTNGDRIDKVS